MENSVNKRLENISERHKQTQSTSGPGHFLRRKETVFLWGVLVFGFNLLELTKKKVGVGPF